MFQRVWMIRRIESVLADQIVITEKTSQAKDVRVAVGSRYGDILPAEGHLLDLLEPEEVSAGLPTRAIRSVRRCVSSL